MSDSNPLPRPKLDDQYWFNLSETLANKALDARDQAAAKLQNLVLWLWGIYTTLAAVGFALAGKNLSPLHTALIVLASACLIVVYWATVWVQMPKLVAFDPRSPDEIREKAYVENVRAKHEHLRIALSLALLASILVATALAVASLAKPEPAQQTPRLAAALTGSGEKRSIAVTGYVGKTDGSPVLVRLSSSKQTFEPVRILATDSGLVQTSVPVLTQETPLAVTLEWKEPSGLTHTLSRDLK
jgi:hypothetical protein